jgi:hypothetical protein
MRSEVGSSHRSQHGHAIRASRETAQYRARARDSEGAELILSGCTTSMDYLYLYPDADLMTRSRPRVPDRIRHIESWFRMRVRLGTRPASAKRGDD